MEKVEEIKKLERESNFELLRLIAILFIILFHFAGEVYFSDEFPGFSVNYAFLRAVRFTGWFGNYMFMMISSWFLMEATFSFKRFFRIWLEVLFYALLITSLFYIFKFPLYKAVPLPHGADASSLPGITLGEGVNTLKLLPISMKKSEVFKSFLPIFFYRAWYPVIYMIFLFFVPFLSILIKNMTERQHRILAIILTAFPFVVLSLPKCQLPDVSHLYRFITIHFIATYIRKYNPKIFQDRKRNSIIGFSLLASFFIWNAGLAFLADKISFVQKHLSQLSDVWTGKNHLPILAGVIFVFCAFRDFNIPTNKFINKCASCTLSAFLLPSHPAVGSSILLLILPLWFSSAYMIPLLLAATLLAYALCVIVDSIRKQFFEKPVLSAIEAIYRKISHKVLS